jgi:putative copper export protein
MRALRAFVVLAAVLVPALALGLGASAASAATPAAAHAGGGTGTAAPPTVRTVPAANEILGQAPDRVVISPAAAGSPALGDTGNAKVLSTRGTQIAGGPLSPNADGSLSLALPTVPAGVYLVSWTAGPSSGAFAFDIDPTDASPAAVVQPKPKTTLSPWRDNFVEWVPLVAIMIFTGALALRFLVVAPAARRLEDVAVAARVDTRLVRLAAIAIVIFVPTTLGDLAYSDGSFDFGSIWPSLGADGDGHLIGARLALTIIAAALVIPIALLRRRPPVAAMAIALVCGLGELAARELPGTKPADLPRGIFNTVLYVAHLFGAAVWIGGLVGLGGIAIGGAVAKDARRAFWPIAIRRFSAVALTAVGVLTLSGLWLYWVHVGGVDQLFTTLYGRTLLVKLIVFAGLVLIGASNQFWLMPKIDAMRAAGDDRRLSQIVLSHFRTVLVIEVALGLGVLFIAPLLGGSARNQHFQASSAVLTKTAEAGSTHVGLTPSGLQPGLLDYRIKVDGDNQPKEVSATFAAAGLGVPAQRVVATSVGDDTYRISGFYTPVVGTWKVQVQLDNAAPATFTLPITAKAAKLPKSLPPKVRWTTWLWGTGETLGVLLLSFGSLRVSKRLTARRIAALPPTSEPERALVDA